MRVDEQFIMGVSKVSDWSYYRSSLDHSGHFLVAVLELFRNVGFGPQWRAEGPKAELAEGLLALGWHDIIGLTRDQQIDPGAVMANGASWNKAVAWRNSIVVLGDRDREISTDYDHRQTNFTHVAFIDLEVRFFNISLVERGG